jgi:hypothetical protein
MSNPGANVITLFIAAKYVKMLCLSKLIFMQLGFSMKLTLEFSSMLICSEFQTGLYTQLDWCEAALMKR